MNELISSKQKILLKRLTTQFNKLTKAMKNQGLSEIQIQLFFIKRILQIETKQKKPAVKVDKRKESQTQAESNSQNSDDNNIAFETAIERQISQKMKQGKSLQQILLNLIENSYVQSQKFKNYLLSQQVKQKSQVKITSLKTRLSKQKPYVQIPHLNNQSRIQDFIQPSLMQNRMKSIKQRYELAKYQMLQNKLNEYNQIDDIQQSKINYLHNFQKNLNQSIRKTKLLRNILQKKLLSGFTAIQTGQQIY